MKSRTSSAAVESAVDAYATRILKEMSPPEACIDESLGPYVTSLLRYSDDGEVTLIPEFESLLELLEEHCSLTSESATSVLITIATAVRTGIIPEPMKHKSNVSVVTTYNMNPDALFHVGGNDLDEFPTLSEAANGGTIDTPLKPDRLIPVDLLGALDDPSTPVKTTQVESTYVEESAKKEEAFPPLSGPTSTKKISVSKHKNASKKKAEDLAAVLFRSSRPRQSSIDSHAESKAAVQSTEQYYPENQQYYHGSQYFHQQWDAVVEMLLSMNPDLTEEAAVEASLVANADVNAAQFIIREAFQAPPICRHMLNDTCYRSDCQFSHDVEGHTCLFWMRGRCGKGASCRFLHGFSDKLLEGFNHELPFEDIEISSSAKSRPVTITTTNLVSHNMKAAFSVPQHESGPFSSVRSSARRSNSFGFESGSYPLPSRQQADSFLSSSWGGLSALETAVQSFHVQENQETNDADGGFSFATIASKGYSGISFTPDESSRNPSTVNGSTPSQSVKIPQDLWNPHINRDSNVFHIPDPMERYAHVSASVSRSDVIDLHYQSTKSFAVVLSSVLPEKLREHGQVWVVMGTGHHVGRSTHQKSGGALEGAVLAWLSEEGYDFMRGRDRNGHGGAVLVRSY
jgi:hypothetical protein